MSNTVLIVGIIAITLIVIIVILRPMLSRLFIRADQTGIEGEVETHLLEEKDNNHSRLTVKGNTQVGSKNKINVKADEAEITNNTQLGNKQTLDVTQPEKPTPKKRHKKS